MELIVKPKNIYNLNSYIKMKADAFIFGMKDYSINATSIVNIRSLTYLRKKIPNKVKIFISIDKNIFDSDIDKLKKILKSLETIKIDGILFYDLALLELRDEMKLTIPFIWNQNYFVTNYNTIKYYKDNLNVSNVVLSNEITIDEIKEIQEKTNSNLFVNTFGYQMMAFSRRKLITSFFKYIKTKNIKKNHYLVDNDNNKYAIKEEKDGTAFLSSFVINYIKELNKFKELNIKYLILDEKCLSRKDFIAVLAIYSDMLNKKATSKELDNSYIKIKDIINNVDTGFLYKKTIYKVK